MLKNSVRIGSLALGISACAGAPPPPSAPVTPVAVEPAPRTDPLRKKLEAVVLEYASRSLFNGTVLVAKGDEIVFARAYGLADAEHEVANTAETVYRIGSTSKQFIGALALGMAERGDLDLDANVITYIPNYPRPQGELVTLRMLLSHTAGLPNYTELPIYRDAMNVAEPPERFLERFSALPLEFEAGSQFKYSNSGYYLLGVILERVSGEDLATLLDRELFAPLGLEHTGYDADPISGTHRAHGYTWDGTRHAPETSVHPTKIFAAGMVYSNAADLLRWTRLLHAGAPFREPSTGRTMTTLPEGKDSNYQFGLGLVPLDLGGERLLSAGHGGGLEGFQSSLLHVPDKEWTVVVLCNTGEEVGPIADALLAVIAGDEPEPPRIPLSREFSRLVEEEDLEAALEWVQEVTTTGGAQISVDPVALAGLGRRYLDARHYEAASAVFGLGVQIQPASANAHANLGDALVASGDPDGARGSYARAVELDPSLDRAKQALEGLGP